MGDSSGRKRIVWHMHWMGSWSPAQQSTPHPTHLSSRDFNTLNLLAPLSALRLHGCKARNEVSFYGTQQTIPIQSAVACFQYIKINSVHFSCSKPNIKIVVLGLYIGGAGVVNFSILHCRGFRRRAWRAYTLLDLMSIELCFNDSLKYNFQLRKIIWQLFTWLILFSDRQRPFCPNRTTPITKSITIRS
jgi:hypothetical protein